MVTTVAVQDQVLVEFVWWWRWFILLWTLQVTSGATEGGAEDEGGGVTGSPMFQVQMKAVQVLDKNGEDGYVLITGTATGTTTSTTIVSNDFTAGAAIPRLVVL